MNGVLGKTLHCNRGVRQGDALSPLLFVLAADFLQTLFNKAKEDGLINLPITQRVGIDFSIVQYAHDTLIIMEGCSSQHMELKQILQIFAMWSGLMVNYSKSVMVPINDSEDHMTSLAADFGCSIGSLPFTYLVMPLGLHKLAVKDFLPLVKKCEGRLLVTSNLLSKGGRLVMVNSILSSLPTFLMFALKLKGTYQVQINLSLQTMQTPIWATGSTSKGRRGIG